VVDSGEFTCAGNAGNPISSDDWGIYAENLTRAQLKELIKDLEDRNYSGKPVVQCL